MSMEILRDMARKRLVALCDGCVTIHRSNRLMSGTLHEDGRYEPAPTMEFIGARAVEINARLDAYMFAIRILDEEFRRIIDPASVDQTVDDPMVEAKPEDRIY